uniref:ubiquitinyl hydrolase 1 n=1 Tax=Parastrongyloides trichosuri TaxID=131310 RepID=A0A0N4ZCY4_PARTI
MTTNRDNENIAGGRNILNRSKEDPPKECPYLHTIKKSFLDFDLQRVCSVSGISRNVYVCLVCGKYLHGQEPFTPAWDHAFDENHRIFYSFRTSNFYCLPDRYKIIDTELENVRNEIDPKFDENLIKMIDLKDSTFKSLDKKICYPGFIGLKNLGYNNSFNVIVYGLAHVPKIRNYFLIADNYNNLNKYPFDSFGILAPMFGKVVRKLWNSRSFKSYTTPYGLLEAVISCSSGKFQFNKEFNIFEFLEFFLNTLHLSLNGTLRTDSTIIFSAFGGKMKEYSKIISYADSTDHLTPENKVYEKEIPFLTLDIPIIMKKSEGLANNHVIDLSLTTLLEKSCGAKEEEYGSVQIRCSRRFELIKFPEYLIITYGKENKCKGKHQFLIDFPITNMDFYDYLTKTTEKRVKYTTYDLLCNVVHDNGAYKIQLLHKTSGKWFEVKDIDVKEISPRCVPHTESCIQIWELNRERKKN